jgi:hypothetical protein
MNYSAPRCYFYDLWIHKKGTKSIEEDAFRVLLGYTLLIPYILYKLHNGEMHLLIFYLDSFLIIGYKHWKEWKRFFKAI